MLMNVSRISKSPELSPWIGSKICQDASFYISPLQANIYSPLPPRMLRSSGHSILVRLPSLRFKKMLESNGSLPRRHWLVPIYARCSPDSLNILRSSSTWKISPHVTSATPRNSWKHHLRPRWWFRCVVSRNVLQFVHISCATWLPRVCRRLSLITTIKTSTADALPSAMFALVEEATLFLENGARPHGWRQCWCKSHSARDSRATKQARVATFPTVSATVRFRRDVLFWTSQRDDVRLHLWNDSSKNGRTCKISSGFRSSFLVGVRVQLS